MKTKKVYQCTLSLLVLATMSTAQAKKTQASILIVPNNGDVASVFQSLQDHGFQFSENISCPASARMLQLTPIAENSKTLRVSCLTSITGTNTKAVSLKEIAAANAKGDPSELEGTATGDPSELEGTATGDPSELEGTATGDPSELEGTATGDPSELEGTATGDPSELEGTATAGAASTHRNPLISLFGKIEQSARSIHAKLYKLIMEE